MLHQFCLKWSPSFRPWVHWISATCRKDSSKFQLSAVLTHWLLSLFFRFHPILSNARTHLFPFLQKESVCNVAHGFLSPIDPEPLRFHKHLPGSEGVLFVHNWFARPNDKIAGRYGAPRPPMTDVGTETAFRLDQRKHFRKSKHLLRSEVSWCDLHLRRSTWHCTIYLVSRSIKNMLSVTDRVVAQSDGQGSATGLGQKNSVLGKRWRLPLGTHGFVRKGIISGVRVQAGLHLDMLDADRSPIMQSAFLPELHRWTSKLNVRYF